MLDTLKELAGTTECSSVCLHSARVSEIVIVLSVSPYERLGKWEACPILKEVIVGACLA
jgi:hypothetical protein